jgi:hypothetical protein
MGGVLSDGFVPTPGVAFLAYTRKDGWVILEQRGSDIPEYIAGYKRGTAGKVYVDNVLAKAPLPPVPDTAA